jgi:hypothetical protein
MQRNRLRAFRFSGKYQDLIEQHFLAIWYTAVHDLVHVLTGYETTWVGEAGVWAHSGPGAGCAHQGTPNPHFRDIFEGDRTVPHQLRDLSHFARTREKRPEVWDECGTKTVKRGVVGALTRTLPNQLSSRFS